MKYIGLGTNHRRKSNAVHRMRDDVTVQSVQKRNVKGTKDEWKQLNRE